MRHIFLTALLPPQNGQILCASAARTLNRTGWILLESWRLLGSGK